MQAEIDWKPTPLALGTAFGYVPADCPHYAAVDIYDVFMDFQDYPGLWPMFQRFPLHRIIEIALSQTAYNHDDQMFWVEFGDRFDGREDLFDLDAIALFFESLAFHLDEVIASRFKGQFDTGNYVFSKWVGPTSLVLRFDENNAYLGDDRSGAAVSRRTLDHFGNSEGYGFRPGLF